MFLNKTLFSSVGSVSYGVLAIWYCGARPYGCSASKANSFGICAAGVRSFSSMPYGRPREINTILTPEDKKAITTMQLLNKLCTQPGSLNYTHFYHYNKSSYHKTSKLLSNLINILNHFFGTFYGIISRPVFLFTQKKLVIFINYYIPNVYSKLFNRHIWKYNRYPSKSAKGFNLELKKLIRVLAKFLNLKVEVQLNQLVYPYHDSTILSKLIALSSNKRRFRTIMSIIIQKALIITDPKKTFSNQQWNKWGGGTAPEAVNHTQIVVPATLPEAQILPEIISEHYNKLSIDGNIVYIHKTVPTVLTGLKVRISGRLSTERVIPKKTILSKEIGGFKRNKSNLVDYAVYTNKNKRGSYSVKVWTTSRICL
jgi:Mitochondrial ribosomal protein (VAR1)